MSSPRSRSKHPSVTDPSDAIDPNARPVCFISTIQECAFVMSVTMAVAMTSAVTGSVTVISAHVAKDLAMTNAQVTWMNAACSLAAGSLLLFFGSVIEVLGGRPLLVGALSTFSIICLGAGFVTNAVALDVLCGLLGMCSAAAVVVPAQGLLGTIYSKPSSRKNKAFGCFSAGSPLGFVLGTMLSGFLTQMFNWRACFFAIAFMYFWASLAAALSVPSDTIPGRAFDMKTVRRLDLPGAGMTITGFGTICAALSLAVDAEHGWNTSYVLVLLLSGLLLIMGFVVWELKYPHALVDMTVFRDRDFTLLLLILSLGFIGFPVFAFWIALYFQIELGYGPLTTGVHLLPMFVVGIFATAIAALLQHKISNKRMMVTGACSYVAAFGLAAAQRHGSSYWAFSFPALCLSVVGVDVEFIVANMYVASSMPANKQAIAGSLLQTLTRLCTALGYSIASAIFEAVKRRPSQSGYYKHDRFAPFAAVFWFAFNIAVTALPFAAFLRVSTQGHRGHVAHEKGDAATSSRDGDQTPVS